MNRIRHGFFQRVRTRALQGTAIATQSWSLGEASNPRRKDYDSPVLPTELPSDMVGGVGFEPTMYLASRIYSPMLSPLSSPTDEIADAASASTC